jgi:hypothetical protein
MFRGRRATRKTVRAARWLASVAIAIGSIHVTRAQQAATLNGPPVQIQPYVQEPGVPNVTITTGMPNPFGGLADGTGGTGTGSGGSTDPGGSDVLNTMMATTWGAQAAANAQALGVNASALAAACVLESGCQNVGGAGTVAGAFQMTASTYTAMINAAVAQNPALASQIVPGSAGLMDPATESIAASEYLLQGARYLQNDGVWNPTVLDVRGYYNFGPQGGANIATAPSSEPMSEVLSMYSPSQLAANGITPGMTVGQWQASVAAKIGNAAGQSVMA